MSHVRRVHETRLMGRYTNSLGTREAVFSVVMFVIVPNDMSTEGTLQGCLYIMDFDHNVMIFGGLL